MSRAVYSSYTKSANINGGPDILAKIRTFALAQGWSEEYYEDDVSWEDQGGGVYAWENVVSPDYDRVLGLRSDGYGSQDLVFRFVSSYHNATTDKIGFYPIEPNNSTINYNSSDPPHLQNDFCYYSMQYFWVPSSTFPEMLVIGNDKVIGVHFRYNSLLCPSIAFGTPELLSGEQSETEMSMFFPPMNQYGLLWDSVENYGNLQSWYTNFGVFYRNFFFDGSTYTDKMYPMVYYNYELEQQSKWAKRGDLVATNAFSGFRSIVSNPLFRQNVSTNIWRNVGWLPNYHIHYSGLSWADIVTRGSNQFICFPSILSIDNVGSAWRIA